VLNNLVFKLSLTITVFGRFVQFRAWSGAFSGQVVMPAKLFSGFVPSKVGYICPQAQKPLVCLAGGFRGHRKPAEFRLVGWLPLRYT
jgi:hypothetical protein